MERELAEIVAAAIAKARSDVGALAPLLQSHLDDGDQSIKLAIGSAVYELGLALDRVFEHHPDIGSAYETRLQKYGRAY